MQQFNKDQRVSDAALEVYLQDIASGSTDALRLLYEKTKGVIYSYILSILRDPHDAQDVMHDTYLRIYRASGSYTPGTKPMAWMYTIAKNLSLMKLRTRKNVAQAVDPDTLIARGHEDETEARVFLIQAFSQLNETEAGIISLHAISGYKHKEIATILQIPLSTVLSKYHRAIKKLKKSFTGENV